MTIRIAVLTISDGCFHGTREDKSGATVVAWARASGHDVLAHEVVPDETHRIVPVLITWADSGTVDVIVTTGGTGLSPRDVTPEATRAVIEREAPGIAEAMRAEGMKKTPRALLSRAVVGTRASTLIVNLPGSTGGVTDGLEVLAPQIEHMVKILHGDTEH